MIRALINYLLYTTGQMVSIYLGSVGFESVACTIIFLSIAAQLLVQFFKNRPVYYQDLLLAIFTLIFGSLFEMFLIAAGLISYGPEFPIISPPWILGLYPLFSQTLNHAFSFVNHYRWTGFLLGAIGGPLAYWGGESLGVVEVKSIHLFFIIGMLWGLFLYFLIRVNLSFKKAIAFTFRGRKELEVLYDGSCPICSAAMKKMKKRDRSLCFVDSSARAYQPAQHGGIRVEEAMEQIHAIDAKGKIFTGIDVLSLLYARTGHRFFSILLQISWLRPLFKLCYRVFAKNRPRHRTKQ
jgi:predicted DCC family thiol-disulfide oxidoreductase YuxK